MIASGNPTSIHLHTLKASNYIILRDEVTIDYPANGWMRIYWFSGKKIELSPGKRRITNLSVRDLVLTIWMSVGGSFLMILLVMQSIL
jgi:hypothetical protein